MSGNIAISFASSSYTNMLLLADHFRNSTTYPYLSRISFPPSMSVRPSLLFPLILPYLLPVSQHNYGQIINFIFSLLPE